MNVQIILVSIWYSLIFLGIVHIGEGLMAWNLLYRDQVGGSGLSVLTFV